MFARESLEIFDHVDVVPNRQDGGGVLRIANAIQRDLQHLIRAPGHIAKDARVENRTAATDQVIATVMGRTDHPIARFEQRERAIDHLSCQPRIVDADGHDLLRAVKEESFRKGHRQTIAQRRAGLHCQRVIAERPAECVAIRGGGRRPEDFNLHVGIRAANRLQQIAQHRFVHRERFLRADGLAEARLHFSELRHARKYEQTLGGWSGGGEHGGKYSEAVRRIALVTDFGTRDPYVAAMKGVIAARTDAPILDCTHEIAPFDLWEAAFYLRPIIRYWPDGTIFAIVIDPGVGTSRRMIAIDSAGKLFLAPDNGVLTFVIGIAHAVENESLFLPDGSTTFHGRDRFAPVAAALANGLSIEQLGPRVEDLARLDYEPPTYERKRAEGTIVAVDRFGNLITDLERSRIPFTSFVLQARQMSVSRMSATYTGKGPFMIIGSTGCVEVSAPQTSAAAALQLNRGDRVTIVPAT